MRKSHVFEAHDGTQFATSDECRDHEETLFISSLTALDRKEVESALNRTNLHLAHAFERIGNLIAAKRRENGEHLRAKKGSKP